MAKGNVVGFILAGVMVVIAFLLSSNPLHDINAKPCFPHSELEGKFSPNYKLSLIVSLASGKVDSPETVIVAPDNTTLITCQSTGTLVAVTPSGKVTEWAHVAGRSLGGAFDKNGNLIMAECQKGLVKIDKSTKLVTVLANRAGNKPVNYADDVAIATDGMIYFSDASSLRVPIDYHARLGYNPITHEATELMTGLYFANGVTLSSNEDYVLICESGAYQIRRYWLKGPKAGTQDIFFSGLPGVPDGITTDSSNGSYYVALVSTVTPILDFLCGWRFPRLLELTQRLLVSLPPWLSPAPADYSMIVHLSAEGNVIRTMHFPGSSKLKRITSITVHGNKLLIGSLGSTYIGVMDK